MSRKKVAFEVNPLLSGPSLETRARTGSPFRYIPVSDIDLDPDQPRRVFDAEKITELSQSIREFGVLSPILVRVQAGGVYRLIAGERRLRACKQLGLDTIPAIIDSSEDGGEETLAKQLVENLQRVDLGSMEKALALGQLRDQFNLSVRDIAAKLGVSKSSVQRSLEVLSLPDDLQAALIAGASETKVLLLRDVQDRELRKKIIAEIENLSRVEIEALLQEGEGGANKVSHGGTPRGKGTQSLSIEDSRLLSEIQAALRMKVNLTRNKRSPERGSLVVEFYSDEDLGELFDRLTR